MADLVLCPMELPPGGKAVVPRSRRYSSADEVRATVDITDPKRKDWGLVIVYTWTNLAAAQADNLIKFIPLEAFDNVIPANRRNQINNQLAQTDLGFTLVAGDTVRDFIRKIGEAIGASEDFVADIERKIS